MKALVLSGGGLFGAYQVGAWKALRERFAPDIIVGASVGSLNGWAIAGGATTDELAERWLDKRTAGRVLLARASLEANARWLTQRFNPKCDFGVVIVEVPALRSRLVRCPDVTWRHLTASCSMPGNYPPVRLEGRLYVDGGILGALPLWAAAQMGATDIVGVSVLSAAPSAWIRGLSRSVRLLARDRRGPLENVTVRTIAPARPLGSLVDAVRWRRENIVRWIEQGECEASVIASSI
ncbi:MAG: patatin-like phospholipase family protein [Bryobacteraceae bacterium]